LPARLADCREAVREERWQAIQAEYWPIAHDFVATVRRAKDLHTGARRGSQGGP
jgi:hypothetical protein